MSTDTAMRAFQKLIEGVQIIGFDFTYLYLNETAERHARRQAGELIGRRMTDCFPGIDRTPMFAVLKRVMQARKPEQFLTEFIYPDGSQGWFELLIEPVPDGLCVLSMDISEKQRAEAQLRQAQKREALGRFAGGIAHDFNDVLTAMLGFCDLVLSRAGDNRELADDLLEIRKAGARAERMTEQLLAFGSTQTMVPRVIDLNRVVLDIHYVLTRVVGDDVQLVIETADDLRHTRADSAQIDQILMNLVMNARDAMPHGGTVRISTSNAILDHSFVVGHRGSVEGEYVAFAVEDTGQGIPAEILPNVFEPFFTTKGPGKGSGLGLPTVYGIVKQSGGYIAVDSTPGIGTTVTTYLPATDAPLADSAPEPAQRSVSGTETLLVVDEDQDTRESMRQLLAAQGYTVLEARDVWDALTLARSRSMPVDLLITDVVMPEMNGPELAEHVRSMHPQVRVLYVSGFEEASVIGSAGVNAHVSFLPEPFGPGSLLAGVRDALDR